MSIVQDIFDNITGRSQQRAVERGTAAQQEAIDRAIARQEEAAALGLEFLSPFGAVGELGLEQAGFLVDPEAQFDFLEQNPLFQFSLDRLDEGTLAGAAARGRLSAGDTLAQLSQNTLLAAQPLIGQQSANIGNLLNLGTGVAQSQANTALGLGSNISNLLQNQGNVQAAGGIAATNAGNPFTQLLSGGVTGGILGSQGLLGPGIGGGIGTLLGLSDSRLKEDAEIIGQENGYDKWRWKWNSLAHKMFGLKGESEGVMFIDVVEKNPEAVEFCEGFGMVNYDMIGVSHG